jgi:hypothetical protein
LIVSVNHAQKKQFLGLERSDRARSRPSFIEFTLQTSSSMLPALETAKIAASIQMLTSGMMRGKPYRVASLPVPKSTPLTLQDLCLILILFPTFSPDYKLREEQCYWFCNVVLSMASVGCSE